MDEISSKRAFQKYIPHRSHFILMCQFWYKPCLSFRPPAALWQRLSPTHNNYDECSVHRNKPAIWHSISLDALAANIPWMCGRGLRPCDLLWLPTAASSPEHRWLICSHFHKSLPLAFRLTHCPCSWFLNCLWGLQGSGTHLWDDSNWGKLKLNCVMDVFPLL